MSSDVRFLGIFGVRYKMAEHLKNRYKMAEIIKNPYKTVANLKMSLKDDSWQPLQDCGDFDSEKAVTRMRIFEFEKPLEDGGDFDSNKAVTRMRLFEFEKPWKDGGDLILIRPLQEGDYLNLKSRYMLLLLFINKYLQIYKSFSILAAK